MTNPHTLPTDCPRADEAYSHTPNELSDDWLAHMESCATCQRALHEVTEMGRLARALPVPAWNFQKVAAGEARLLAALRDDGSVPVTQQADSDSKDFQGDHESDAGDWLRQLPEVPAQRVRAPRYAWALLAAAFLLGFGVLLARTTTSGPAEGDVDAVVAAMPIYRASVHSDNARYALVSPQPNEIIRLYEGTITVSVQALQPGERFRVITGDGEVEVHGTIFDVVAEGDSLATVRVHEGVVAVRPEDQPATQLRLGERWTSHAETTAQAPEAPVAAPAETQAPAAIELPTDPSPTTALQADAALLPEARIRSNERLSNPFEPAPTAGNRTEAESSTVDIPRETAASATAAAPPATPRGSATGADELAFQRGWELLEQGQASAAATAFSQVGSGSAVAEDAAFWRGIALGRNRQLQASERALVQFTRQYPSSARVAEAWLAVGMIRLQYQGTDAREALERARDLGTGAVRARADEALQQLDATRVPE